MDHQLDLQKTMFLYLLLVVLHWFEKTIDKVVTDKCRKGCFVVNTITEFTPGNEKMDSTLMEHKTSMENLFVGFVQKGINSGEISSKKNAQELGLMLFTLYNGIRVVSKVDTSAEKLQKVLNSGLSVLEG